MAIKTTIYKPDKYLGRDASDEILICNCEVELSWDDTVALDQRKHTLIQFVKKCITHAKQTDNEAFTDITKNAIRTQTWSPDTCGCRVHELWDLIETTDGQQKGYNGTIKFIAGNGNGERVKQCKVHEAIENLDDLHSCLVIENMTKNEVMSHIKENFNSITIEKVQDDGNLVTEFTPGKEPSWSFDEERNLQISSPHLSNQKRTQLKAHCDKAFGVGKVVIG